MPLLAERHGRHREVDHRLLSLVLHPNCLRPRRSRMAHQRQKNNEGGCSRTVFHPPALRSILLARGSCAHRQPEPSNRCGRSPTPSDSGFNSASLTLPLLKIRGLAHFTILGPYGCIVPHVRKCLKARTQQKKLFPWRPLGSENPGPRNQGTSICRTERPLLRDVLSNEPSITSGEDDGLCCRNGGRGATSSVSLHSSLHFTSRRRKSSVYNRIYTEVGGLSRILLVLRRRYGSYSKIEQVLINSSLSTIQSWSTRR
jgi:hypothetical protein